MSSVDELKSEYAKWAAEHGRASEDGDSRSANRAYRKLVAAYHGLQARGKEGQDSISQLMEDSDAAIRCWAASHCLESEPERAVAKLRKIAEGTGAIAFSAEIILEEWAKGSLPPD